MVTEICAICGLDVRMSFDKTRVLNLDGSDHYDRCPSCNQRFLAGKQYAGHAATHEPALRTLAGQQTPGGNVVPAHMRFRRIRKVLRGVFRR